MKTYLWGVVAFVLFVPLVSVAMEYRLSETPSVGPQDIISEDLYMAGGSVSSAGTVEGDVYAAGGTIVITGPVSQDVVAAGGNLSVTAPVADDVRVAGGNVLVQSTIGGDLLAAGGQVTVVGEGVAGDASLAGGMVRLDAPVGGDLFVGGGNVLINASITGDVVVEADSLTLGSGAVISGNLWYRSVEELTQEEGAVIMGDIVYEKRQPIAPSIDTETAMAAIMSVALIWQFLTLLVCASVIGLFFNRYCKTLVEKATSRPLPHIGLGLVVLIVLPIASLLLFISLVGIPLGLLGLVGFGGLLLITWLVAPIVLGSYVSNYFFKSGTNVTWKTILIGVVLYMVLGMIPILGWLVQLFLALLTVGALASLQWDVAKQWR